eukprot:m51a1_g9987 inositol-phosphate phosphatase, putative (183) ;mRNA; r:30708-31256
MRVVVASKNRAKIEAVRAGFQQAFPAEAASAVFTGVGAASGVSAQPMSSAETLLGALNRVCSARASVPDADYWVALEGGLDGDFCFAWAAVEGAGRPGERGTARTASFPLPREVTRRVAGGEELGPACDAVFGALTETREGPGAIGLLTQGAITRAQLYSPAVVMALIPFTNPSFSFSVLHQ